LRNAIQFNLPLDVHPADERVFFNAEGGILRGEQSEEVGCPSPFRCSTREYVDKVFLRKQEWERAILAEVGINCPTF
jgi:hypothetical protein